LQLVVVEVVNSGRVLTKSQIEVFYRLLSFALSTADPADARAGSVKLASLFVGSLVRREKPEYANLINAAFAELATLQ